MVLAQQIKPPCRGGFERGALMDPKLTILLMLIAAVIGLSHLNDERLGQMRRQLVRRHWREFVPGRRKS
jgi:hypothetical protein